MYIWLGFIPLAIRYIKYILEQTQEDYILYLEPLYKAYPIPKNEEQEKDWRVLHGRSFHEYYENAKPIREFMFHMMCTYDGYNYEAWPTWDVVNKHYTFDEIFEKCLGDRNKMPKDMKEVVERDFYDLMPLLLILDVFLDDYNYVIEHGLIKRRYRLKDWNIGIYSVYLVCWVYILVISISTFTLSGNELILLTHFQDNTDPFS
jgi:hypothetical protein